MTFVNPTTYTLINGPEELAQPFAIDSCPGVRVTTDVLIQMTSSHGMPVRFASSHFRSARTAATPSTIHGPGVALIHRAHSADAALQSCDSMSASVA